MGELLNIEQSSQGRQLRLVGELDASNADDLREALQGHLDSIGDVTLEVSGLRFVDSSGIRVLVQAAQALGDRGKLVLMSPEPAVLRVLELMGLEKLENLRVVRTNEEPGGDHPAP